MDRNTLKKIREDLTVELKKVGRIYNLDLEVGRMTFDSVGFRVKLTGTQKTADGGNAKREKDWKDAVQFNLVEDEWLNKTTTDGYKVIGYSFKKRKNCMILTKNGKEYSCPSQMIKRDMLVQRVESTQNLSEKMKKTQAIQEGAKV